MSYLKIKNLYKATEILLFKEAYALEKVDGTSCHIGWKDNKLFFFSGCIQPDLFESIFDKDKLKSLLLELYPNFDLIIFGEGYAGKVQKQSKRYGKDTSFIVFDVKINGFWLDVLNAEQIATKLGLEFVPYKRIPATIEAVDAERDADSIVAVRRGCGEGHIREGVVLRPIIEMTLNNGDRLIAKHKREEFAERQHSPKVVDVAMLEILSDANAIADEWVNEMRLIHVLDKNFIEHDMQFTKDVIQKMTEDIEIEASGEIGEITPAVRTAIGRKTAQIFKQYLTSQLNMVE